MKNKFLIKFRNRNSILPKKKKKKMYYGNDRFRLVGFEFSDGPVSQ